MRLTHLAVSGLKQWDDFGMAVESLTAIQGPNGSGKSALIQATRLGLLGYDPKTGKKLSETRTLVGELGTADISLSFDTGFGIRRRFGSESQLDVSPSNGETTIAEGQARIVQETGGVVVALDLGEFLSLSAEKRQAWLFEKLPRDLAALDEDTFLEWTEPEDGHSFLKPAVGALWHEIVAKAPNPVVGVSNADSIVQKDFLEAEDGRRAQVTAVASAEARLAQKTKEANAYDANAHEDCAGRLADINQRIGETRTVEEAVRQHAQRVLTLRKAYASLERTSVESEAAQLNRRQDLAFMKSAEELDTEEAGLQEDKRALVLVRQLEQEQKSAKADLDAVRDEMERSRFSRFWEAIAVVIAALWALIRGEGNGTLAEIAEQFRVAVSDPLTRATALLARIDTIGDEKFQAYEEIRSRSDSLDLVADRRVRLHELQGQVAEADRRMDLLGESMEEARAALQEAVNEAPPEPGDGRALMAELHSTQKEMAEHEINRDAGVLAEAEERRVADEKATLEDLTLKATALKKLRQNLRALRARLIEQMIVPLETAAAEVLREIDPEKEFRFLFEREGRAVMDFGFEENGVLRLFGAASKGERMLLSVALVTGLLAVLDPPFKILIVDDVEAVDEIRRHRLMRALRDIQRTRAAWSNVILAGACDLDHVPGWHVLDLSDVGAHVALNKVPA